MGVGSPSGPRQEPGMPTWKDPLSCGQLVHPAAEGPGPTVLSVSQPGPPPFSASPSLAPLFSASPRASASWVAGSLLLWCGLGHC